MGQQTSNLEIDPTLTTRMVQHKALIHHLVDHDYNERNTSNTERWLSDDAFTINDALFKVFPSIRISTVTLSAIGVCINILLFITLITDSETKKWHIFPILVQIICDVIGPGMANIVYEMIFGVDKSSIFENDSDRVAYNMDFLRQIPLSRISDVFEFESKFACLLTYFRQLFPFPHFLCFAGSILSLLQEKKQKFRNLVS